MSETSETDAILRRIRERALATEAVSAATASTIASQHDEISRICNQTENVQQELKLTDRIIQGIDSWTGKFRNFFTSSDQPEPATDQQRTFDLASGAKRNTPSSGSSQHHSTDPLDEVEASLSTIKQRSLAISESIKRQNEMLETANSKMDSSKESLASQNRRISNRCNRLVFKIF
jgi:hypothetical protein